MTIIDDIVSLDKIVEKLAWKHNVLPSEVEEVLSGSCRIFKKEKKVKLKGNICIMRLAKPVTADTYRFFLSRNLATKPS